MINTNMIRVPIDDLSSPEKWKDVIQKVADSISERIPIEVRIQDEMFYIDVDWKVRRFDPNTLAMSDPIGFSGMYDLIQKMKEPGQ